MRSIFLSKSMQMQWSILDTMAVKFDVGEKFDTLSDLEKKIENYEQTNCVKLWKRDSRKIESAVKKKSISADKVPSVEEQEKLKYYEVQYACLHGGRKHKTASNGKRASHTFRDNCPFKLMIRLSDDE